MRKFYGLVFLGQFSRIFDSHPYPFYPKVTPCMGNYHVKEVRAHSGEELGM